MITGMTDLANYDYDLPRELIAQFPLSQRADARLLIVNRQSGTLEHAHIRDLPDSIQPNDCLVLNDTKVTPARLVGFRTQTKGRWEGLVLGTEDNAWRILGKTRGNLQPGETITLQDREGRDDLQIAMLSKLEGGAWAARPLSEEPKEAILNRVGRVPLPPYIRGGQMVDGDVETYQTVYAEHPGAVAAPTAGLHFTESLLQQISNRRANFAKVTLHVGLGTFRPISAKTLDEHEMHSEEIDVPAKTCELVKKTREDGARVIAVGTTCVRALESAASQSAESRSEGMEGSIAPFRGPTDLFIKPGYRFSAVDALLTNFHLPKSTLLVLVSAFAGHELIRRAYEEAIAERYRFYSYGDAMLIV